MGRGSSKANGGSGGGGMAQQPTNNNDAVRQTMMDAILNEPTWDKAIAKFEKEISDKNAKIGTQIITISNDGKKIIYEKSRSGWAGTIWLKLNAQGKQISSSKKRYMSNEIYNFVKQGKGKIQSVDIK